jgi:hypothetical protein
MTTSSARPRPPELEETRDPSATLGGLLRRSLAVLVAIVILAGVALVVATKLGDAPEDLLEIDPWLLAASVANYALLQTGLMVLWRRLLGELDGGFGAGAERSAWAVSQLGKYVPTGAALFVARVMLAARARGSRRLVLTSSLYELGCSFLAAVAITAAAVGSMPELSGSLFRWVVYAVPVPLLAVLHPRVFVPVANAALRRLGREEMTATLRYRRVLGYVLGYAALFAFAGLGILALAVGLADVPGDRAWIVVATFALGYVASALGFLIPAGIGARESGMSLALATVLPTSVAVSVSVVSRLIQVAVECAMAAALAAGRRRRP